MQRFFFNDEMIVDGTFTVNDEKHNHIVRVLRMSIGEKAIFCDGNFNDFECELIEADSKKAVFKVLSEYTNKTEPDVKITVFQCLPKGEKMDDMVKRCVQYGVYEIIPVISKRCVSRPDKKSAAKKAERFNKIARSSAMQSMRGYIPKVKEMVDFQSAVQMLRQYSTGFICYENEKDRIITDFSVSDRDIAFLIGPEGGLDETEIKYACDNGIECVSLGKRILRTEDAATFLIPILLSATNNL